MKFTKEEAFEKLKGYLTNSGRKSLRMSERSLDGQIETLMPIIANDEMELDDFFEKVKGSFEIMNSNVEKDRADFVKEWKKANQPTNANANAGQDNNDPSADDVNQKLLERIAALESKMQEEEKNKSINKKRSDLQAKMKEKGIDDAEWSNMVLAEIAIAEDLDIESKADSLLKLYNKQKANTSQGWTPQPPSGGDKDKDPFASVKALKKQRDNARKEII